MLGQNGLMVVSTPNYSGILARLLGSRDPYMTPPEHLNFFTYKGMQSIFDGAKLMQRKRTCFGTLTKNQIGRVVEKYLPRPIHPLKPVIIPLIPIGMRALNFASLGIEQEFYLSKLK